MIKYIIKSYGDLLWIVNNTNNFYMIGARFITHNFIRRIFFFATSVSNYNLKSNTLYAIESMT